MEIFIFVTLIFYIMYFILIISNKKRLERYKNSKEIVYITTKFKFDINKINFKKLAHKVVIVNSISMGAAGVVLTLIENYLLALLVTFIFLIAFIYLGYQLVGYYEHR